MIAKTLSQVAAGNGLVPWATCLALVLFSSFFLAMLLWTTRKGREPLYQAMSRMPLSNELTELPEVKP